MTFRGKILVIRGGAIGDFILTLPAIRALRDQFPEAFLEILGYPHIAQLARAGELVNKVQSIEAGALAGFFARNGNLDEDLCDYFSEFDLIISYLYDPDAIFQKNVGRCSRAQFLEGPHRPSGQEAQHAALTFLKPLERLAIFEADPIPRLTIGKAAKKREEAGDAPVSKPLLALHPGSGSESKNWPEAKWAELLERLVLESYFYLLIIGGEAEGERLQRLSAALPPVRFRVAQSLSLTDLAKLLEGASCYVGHDSGISHLAAALDVPGIVLWSETDETIWRPANPKIEVIRDKAGLDKLPVAKVFESLKKVLRAGFR